jgi:hypothetical protein
MLYFVSDLPRSFEEVFGNSLVELKHLRHEKTDHVLKYTLFLLRPTMVSTVASLIYQVIFIFRFAFLYLNQGEGIMRERRVVK